MIFHVITSYGRHLLSEGFVLPECNLSFIGIVLIGFQVTFQSTRHLVLICFMTFLIIVAITCWAGSLLYFLSNVDYWVIYRGILFILTYVNQIKIFLICCLCIFALLRVNELRLQLRNTWLWYIQVSWKWPRVRFGMSDTPARQTLDDLLVVVACRYKACAFKYLSLAVLS